MLIKMRPKGTKPDTSFPTPKSSTQMPPISPSQNIKQSPSSYQVTSPVNNSELDYSAVFNGEFGNTEHSSVHQISSSSVLHQNNITPNINFATHSTLHMGNVNPNMNTPPIITGLHHANQGLMFHANNNSVHRFTARIPAGTKIKRPKPEQNHSGELLPKRDKLMSPDFEDLKNDEFNITNEPVPYYENIPVLDAYLPIKGENIVNQNNPGLSNQLPGDSNINESEILSDYLDTIWPYIQEMDRNKTIHSIIQVAENWMSELPNLSNHLSSHNVNRNVHNVDQNLHNVGQNVHDVDQNGMLIVMPKVEQNLVNNQIVDQTKEESVSEELRRMML